MKIKIPELLIPAGSLSKLQTAIAYGADAIYVGAADFSMRPLSASMTVDQLAQAVDIVQHSGKKIYVGVNSLLFEDDLSKLEDWLETTAGMNFDAIIVADPAALMLAKRITPNREIHVSTQLSTSNSLVGEFWASAGASRVVLARECTLDNVKSIASKKVVDVEIFVHGAMCMAVSGRCLLSAHFTGLNASRGQCKHTCRWDWQLVEQKRPGMTMPVFETAKETIFLGSTDLCLIEHIPRIIDSGVVSLKVEGRMKGEYYVAAVTRVYRDALDKYASDPHGFKFEQKWMDELLSVTHQPYDTGFALGYPAKKPQSLQTNERISGTHDVFAIVQSGGGDTYSLEAKRPFASGDKLEWIGPDMAEGKVKIAEIFSSDGEVILKSHCGDTVKVRLENSVNLPAWTILRKRTA